MTDHTINAAADTDGPLTTEEIHKLLRRTLVACATIIAFVVLVEAASANVYCVNVSDPSCTNPSLTLTAAFNGANANPGGDDIRIGPGTYSDGPYADNGSDPIDISGAGAAQTEITLPDSMSDQYYLSLNSNGSSVSDLKITLTGGTNSADDGGLVLSQGASATGVGIVGPGTDSNRGLLFGGSANGPSMFRDGFVALPTDAPSGNRAVFSNGPGAVEGSTISGSAAFFHSSPGTTLDVRSTSVLAGFRGLETDGGNINVSNTLIQLEPGISGGIGLAAENGNPSSFPKSINARHVTIVGGDPTNSTGVRARSGASGALQTSTVMLADSVISGPSTAIDRFADNNGAQGGPSVAAIDVSFSNYDPATVTDSNGANGSGAITTTSVTNLAPGFAGGGNFALAPTSALVDIGDPAAGGGATDVVGGDRVEDGNGDGTARRDIGAYEVQDTAAPDTSISGGPDGDTDDNTPTFAFTSTEPGSTFRCSLDGGAFGPCSGPGASHTTEALADGGHSLSVRAVDQAGNTDGTAAARLFTVTTPDPEPGPNVDTTAPETTLVAAPRKIKKAKLALTFTSSEAGPTFECKLDRGTYAPCTSPASLKRLKRGKHRFSVRATDAAGNTDATPATTKFKRAKRRR